MTDPSPIVVVISRDDALLDVLYRLVRAADGWPRSLPRGWYPTPAVGCRNMGGSGWPAAVIADAEAEIDLAALAAKLDAAGVPLYVLDVTTERGVCEWLRAALAGEKKLVGAGAPVR